MGSISFLKKLNQNMPDGIKRIGSPLIRRQLTENAVFRQQYAICQQMRNASADEIASYQQKQLQALCAFAYDNVPYYREVFDAAGIGPRPIECKDDLSGLPLLTKDVLRDRFEDLQAKSVDDYYEATTGGSTGVPIRVNLERSSIYRERAFIYSFWSLSGYDYRKSKLATFRGIEFGGKVAKPNPLYNEVVLNPFSLTEETLPAYLKEIDSFSCDYIQGYPSAIANFCRLLEGAGLKPKKPIKAVFFISESVQEGTAKYISSILGCPCRAFYGHSERAVFAEQTDDELLYLFNPIYGISEVVDHADGNIVCTGFLNRRMPLIRYAVDDLAEPFPDGRYAITGHHDGAELIGYNGERITQTALNFHDDTFDNIEGGYQLVQFEIGKAECRVLPSRPLSEIELASIESSLRSKTGTAIEWTIVQDRAFELTVRGKAKLVVQHVSILDS